MSKRKVSYVRFHSTSTHVPGFGHIERTLPMVNKTVDEFKMEADANGVEVSFRGRDAKRTKVNFMIPFGNLEIVVYHDDTESQNLS